MLANKTFRRTAGPSVLSSVATQMASTTFKSGARIRAICLASTITPGPGILIVADHHTTVGGRAEWATPEGKVQWLGFIWKFSYDQGHLKPILSPTYMDDGVETRVRHLHLSGWGDTVVTGFSKTSKNKDQAFVKILRPGQ